jgi:putative peptidoglycan lipid II flippase
MPHPEGRVSEDLAVDRTIAQVGRSAAALTVAVGIGQLFGIGRELFVASQVGIDAGLDALLVALVVPTMLAGLLMSGTSTALIPAYAAIHSERGGAEARRFASAILTATGLIGASAMILVVGAGSAVMTIAGPGLSPESREAGLGFLALMAPIIVLSPLAGLVSAVCQIDDRFVPISIGAMLAPTVGFLVTVVGWSELGLTALALGTSAGVMAHLVILTLGAVHGGLLARPTLRVRATDMRAFVRHALPLWASSMTLQLNLLVDRAISSILAVGAVSALRFGEGIIRIPLTSIGPAWGMVLYPTLVRFAQSGTPASLGEAAVVSFRYVLAIFLPLSAATVALAPLIVDVAYRRGAFGAEAASATASVAAALAPMIILTMAEPILVGAHNSRRRGTLLLIAGILNVAIHIVLAIGLGQLIGVAGVALASSLTMAVVMGFLAIRLAGSEPAFDLGIIVGTGVRALVASAVVALPIGAWTWLAYEPGAFLADLALLVVLTTLGMIGYLLVAGWLGLSEPAEVVHTIRRRLPRPLGALG